MATAQGKGLMVFALLAFMTIFGFAAVFQVSYEGFDVDVSIHSVNIIDNGEYSVLASLVVTNTNDYDAELHSVDVTVYTDDTESFVIFSYEITDKISIKAGESYETGDVEGRISLKNDNIPDRVYVVIDNLQYQMDGRIYTPEKDGFWFDFDLDDYLT